MKTSILGLVALALLATSSAHAQEAKTKSSTLEFTTIAPNDFAGTNTLYSLPAKPGFAAGTYYFYNGANDPKLQPAVGEDKDGGRKFIRLDGNAALSDMPKANAYLARYVKIPEGAPKEIHLTFDTKRETKPLTGWENGNGLKYQVKVFFAKGDRRTQPAKLTTDIGEAWTTQDLKLPIPAGAEYLVLAVNAAGNDKIYLANWTIH